MTIEQAIKGVTAAMNDSQEILNRKQQEYDAMDMYEKSVYGISIAADINQRKIEVQTYKHCLDILNGTNIYSKVQ